MHTLDISVLADIAGCLGLALSICIALSNWLSARERFDIKILDYSDSGGTTRFLIAIYNRSRSPLTICHISFCGTICELEPKKVRGTPPAWNSVASVRFPIRIHPRDAELSYIEFVDCPYTRLEAGTSANFQIQTIRRTVRKTVVLGRRAHYLNKRSRSQ